MPELFQTPRINGAVLGQFVGRTICIVARVLSYQEGNPEAQVQTSDAKVLTVQVAPGSSWTSGFVEVIGHLHDENTLQEFKSTDFGEKFDMETYDKAIQLMTGKYSHLFYGDQELNNQ